MTETPRAREWELEKLCHDAWLLAPLSVRHVGGDDFEVTIDRTDEHAARSLPHEDAILLTIGGHLTSLGHMAIVHTVEERSNRPRVDVTLHASPGG